MEAQVFLGDSEVPKTDWEEILSELLGIEKEIDSQIQQEPQAADDMRWAKHVCSGIKRFIQNERDERNGDQILDYLERKNGVEMGFEKDILGDTITRGEIIEALERQKEERDSATMLQGIVVSLDQVSDVKMRGQVEALIKKIQKKLRLRLP